MANISDYLDWRGDITLEKDPFNEVDNLVLAQLAYTDFDGIVPGVGQGMESITIQEAHDTFFSIYSEKEIMARTSTTKVAPFLMHKMVKSERFKHMRLMNYINEIDEENQTQFSAVSFLLDDHTIYVAYRGTDNTIVGWKEDFNMSFLYQTPGQIRAAQYLNDCYGMTEYPLIVGGHSKGGNFAVYASAFCKCSVQDRIVRVYSNDGPGFLPEITSQEPYRRITERVISTIPESSIVGMLLENDLHHRVVKSSQTGAMQHDAMSWKVLGNHFVFADNLSESSVMLDRTLKNWVYGLEADEREEFVDILFGTLQSTGASTLDELTANKFAMMCNISKSLSSLPQEKQMVLKDVIRRFAYSSGETLADNMQEKLMHNPLSVRFKRGTKNNSIRKNE